MDTTQRIRDWWKEGKRRRATHLIVTYNKRDDDFKPVYVHRNQNVRAQIKAVNDDYALTPVEVYDFSKDIEAQLTQARTWNV